MILQFLKTQSVRGIAPYLQCFKIPVFGSYRLRFGQPVGYHLVANFLLWSKLSKVELALRNLIPFLLKGYTLQRLTATVNHQFYL